MTAQAIAVAMQRVASVLLKRPLAGIVKDAPAVARWCGDTRVVTQHGSGMQVVTDMPQELGGTGDRPSPGWLLRAALSSCAVTRIAMAAAAEGIVLSALEAEAVSRSDARGLLGMADEHGVLVSAGPSAVELHVNIAAPGVDAQRLRTLVEASCRCSPIGIAMESTVPVALHVDVSAG